MSQFNRRTFVGASVASVAGSMLPGAITAQDSSPVATPEGDYAPQTGVERETLVVGTYGLPASMMPTLEMSNVGGAFFVNPYETLIRRDYRNNDALVPMLAASWTQVSDTEWEFTLRDDVTFHNGAPMTADDVVFTFDRLINASEGSDLLTAAGRLDTLASVEALDDVTVRMKTIDPDPVLLKRLTDTAAMVVSRSYMDEVGDDEYKRSGMGTGPLRIVSFTPDNEVVLERYDGYWGDAPMVRNVTFRVIPELAARITALVNGEVDIINNVSPDQVASLESHDNVEIRRIPLANCHQLSYNTHQPGMQDKRLRQALNLAIDRDLIIDALWLGEAVHKRGYQWEDFGELYNPDRPLTPYDPERARQLVEESDYNGEVIYYQLVPGYYVLNEQVGQTIVEMWKEVGINAEVQFNDAFLSGDERWAHTWSMTNLLSDPSGALFRQYGPGQTPQELYWDAPDEFNRLGMEAATSLDTQLRYDNYQAILDIWDEEAPGTDLYDPVDIYGVRRGVNWEPTPKFQMDFRPYNLSFDE